MALGYFRSVDKRYLRALLLAITFALVGSVAMQAYLIRNTISLRQAQFTGTVAQALLAVSDRLERIEKLGDLRGHELGRLLLEGHGTERGLKTPEATEQTPTLGLHIIGQDGRNTYLRLPEEDSLNNGPPRIATARTGPRAMDREELLTEMVRGILTAERRRDITSRIDPQLLDSLIKEELRARGVDMVHEHGVFDEEGHAVLMHLFDPDDEGVLRASPNRVKLFRNDLSGPTYALHVHMPDERTGSLWALWPMLALAALFIIVLVLAFWETVRTIVRQKRINEIKNDLVNNLTHELKTPISTIGLACEAITDPSVPKTEQQVRSFVGMIRDENKRLGILVENVLQSAVMDSGRMRLKLVDLDLHALLQDVVRNSGIQAAKRDGRIEMDLKAELHHVQGDRIHLTNVFHNLLDNALKYTEKEPRVMVTSSNDATSVTISFMDNGIGIPRGEQGRIFDKLYRVPTGNIHNVKGFGLGLSYVQGVVERHHGRIRVDSEPGQGSTFHITLPFEHGDADQAAGR